MHRKLEPVTQTYQLVKIILDYLYGEPLDFIRAHLQYEANESRKNTKALFEAIKLGKTRKKNDKNKETDYVSNILEALGIQKEDHHQLKVTLDNSENLYALIFNLYHQGHTHLGDLLKLIYDTKPKPMWALVFILGTLLTGGLGLLFYYKGHYFEAIYDWLDRTFPKVCQWIGKTFTSIKNIPLVGIAPRVIALLWIGYNTLTNPLFTTYEKINYLFFKSITTGMVVAAYVLSFQAAGLMPLPVALLFIGAECIHLLRSSYRLYQCLRRTEKPQHPDQDSWDEIAPYYRAKCDYKRARQIFMTEVIAACLTTAVIILWCLMPPSLMISVFSVCFIAMVDLAKYSMISTIKTNTANTLQKNLRDAHTLKITESPEASLKSNPSSSLRSKSIGSSKSSPADILAHRSSPHKPHKSTHHPHQRSASPGFFHRDFTKESPAGPQSSAKSQSSL